MFVSLIASLITVRSFGSFYGLVRPQIGLSFSKSRIRKMFDSLLFSTFGVGFEREFVIVVAVHVGFSLLVDSVGKSYLLALVLFGALVVVSGIF